VTRHGGAGQVTAPRPAASRPTVPPATAGGTVASLGTPLPGSFYDRDPRIVARELLGAVLACDTPDGLAAGVVVETEAYLGDDDPACHAVAGRTARTWHLFGPPGTAYVYRIYGMHWCVNAVTLAEGVGSAVLLRAVAPLLGIDLMRRRRPRARRDRQLTNGPGKLCAALGIDGRHDGAPLRGPGLSLHAGTVVDDARVIVTPRIGITRAADRPYRFLVRDDPFVSPTPSAFPRRAYRDA
jgi:DNA-3-methyladenine glycosylase